MPVGDQDRQVAAINDPTTQGMGLLDEPAKIRVHLGRAAGDVERGNLEAIECRDDRLGCLTRHAFAAIGASIDMAVRTRLIAKLANVDLQDLNAGCLQDRQRMLSDGFVKLWEASDLIPLQDCSLGVGLGQFAVASYE